MINAIKSFGQIAKHFSGIFQSVTCRKDLFKKKILVAQVDFPAVSPISKSWILIAFVKSIVQVAEHSNGILRPILCTKDTFRKSNSSMALVFLLVNWIR